MKHKSMGIKAERETLKRVAGSGAWIGAKGDFRSDDFLIEQKATERDSRAIKLEELRKIEREALQTGRRPAFALIFADSQGRPRPSGAWVMVRESDWQEMTEGRNDESDEE